MTEQFLSRGVDYLQDLGSKLRDLGGFSTLANELIQNADDAPEATEISFDVCEDALVVDNDGSFTDCGHMELRECPWTTSKGHRCDFHRFRLVASGDKRQEAGTAGAFGIGFIAVYQITDHPELISGERHWILHEENAEDKRIIICPGCAVCGSRELPKTRFIFPWAVDGNSRLRMALRADHIKTAEISGLVEQWRRLLPMTMLFLKQLGSIKVKKNGVLALSLERIVEDNSLIITDGNSDQVWHLLRGDFEQPAKALRAAHPGKIEPKRGAHVTLAIPEALSGTGVLCAFLPTEHETGLPFLINADFFSTNDRKRILFESGYQSEWNGAAIAAAANIVGAQLEQLPSLLGHTRLWHLLDALHKVAEQSAKSQRPENFDRFWKTILHGLSERKIIFSGKGEWNCASEVLLLERSEEEQARSILEDTGLSIVHADLRPHFNLLSARDGFNVALLDIPHFVQTFNRLGLHERRAMADLPVFLRTPEQLSRLWKELGLLLDRRRKPEEQKSVEAALAGCAIALGRDGMVWPCRSIYRADVETVKLFGAIDPDLSFLADLGADGAAVSNLCPEFGVRNAIARLSKLPSTDLSSRLGSTSVGVSRLLAWFEVRVGDLMKSGELRQELANLPIYPSGGELRRLSELALPGDFIDPLHLTGFVDLDALGGRREFLLDLGARRLTFTNYARDHASRAFTIPNAAVENKRQAVLLLASRLGEIKDDVEANHALAAVPMVECVDGEFRTPAEVYLSSETVAEILGQGVPTALIPPDHQQAMLEFYGWLGVAAGPRMADLVERVRSLAAHPPSANAQRVITSIFRYLSELTKDTEFNREAAEELKEIAWLPARGDSSRWYAPNALYASFQDYLFESQARFLDVPHNFPSGASLVAFLGIHQGPAVQQVINHLLKYADDKHPVNREVYVFLNGRAQDSAIAQLRRKRCLLLENNNYVSPEDVFWGDHPFGRSCFRLSPELRKFNDLFTRLGVREVPDHTDALRIIERFSREFGSIRQALGESEHAEVLAAWQLLDRALETGTLDRGTFVVMRDKRVIPNASRVLAPPTWMFFEDRAGLAAKFPGVLETNVIARPQGAWRAMEAAGVRALRGAVRAQIIEITPADGGDVVSQRVTERRLELVRVLEGSSVTRDITAILESLLKVDCQAASRLAIQYTLDAFDRSFLGQPEEAPAHFNASDKTLYFALRNGELPWSSIARELALMIDPDEEPGRLASGLKEVLAPESLDAARSSLDELGYPPLAEVIDGATGQTEPVELGGDASEPGASVAEPEAILPAAGHPPPAALTPGGVIGAIATILGPNAPLPGPMPPGVQLPPGGTTDRPRTPPVSGGKGGKVDTGIKKKGRFRTYVTTAGDTDSEPDGDTGERSEVEKAGVARVMVYEESQKRRPREMPPLHPGYDVESRDGDGRVVRYIEVKSLSGRWDSYGAGISRTQFDKGRELGDRYWLYIVERAKTENARIYRIQNPAGQVNQFLYDDGWEALAEPDDLALLSVHENDAAAQPPGVTLPQEAETNNDQKQPHEHKLV